MTECALCGASHQIPVTGRKAIHKEGSRCQTQYHCPMGCRTRNAIVGCFHTGRSARPAEMHQNKIRKVNISETCQGSRVDNCSLRAVQSVTGSSDDTAIKNTARGNISRRKNGLPMTKKKTRVLRFKTLLIYWLILDCNSVIRVWFILNSFIWGLSRSATNINTTANVVARVQVASPLRLPVSPA